MTADVSLLEQSFSGGTDVTESSHLFRLFVGWVPKAYTEQDLKPLFEQCGSVKDLIILKDKVTGQSRGCAFVSFATKEEAEVAISKLDRQVHLPGAFSSLEVRFAKSHQYIQAGEGPEDNRQLFFARLPTTVTEQEVTDLFSKYGTVEDINLFRERRTHISKGCGFITLGSREEAMQAMEALDDKYTVEGAIQPIAVKWADPDLQVKKRRAVEDSNAENRMLFFAKVLRSASEEEVKALFSGFGKVYDVNLFRAFQGAPTTKGCGLVTMGSHEEAAAAIEALDNKHVWPGMDSPMVVKWMDAQLQKRRREEHLAAMRQGLIPSMGMGPDVWMPSMMGGAPPMMAPMGMRQPKVELSEPPPPGCHQDAMKLFVGNIPKSYTEEQLKPFFDAIGKVVELVIVRDKATHESKGSAFVWYQTRAQAERAIMNFNIRHVLPDPTGEQDRPLVVRKANTRQKLPAAMNMMHSHMDHSGLMGDMPVHLQNPMGSMMQAPMGMPPAAYMAKGSMGLASMGMGIDMGAPEGHGMPMGSSAMHMDHPYRMQSQSSYRSSTTPTNLYDGAAMAGEGGMSTGSSGMVDSQYHMHQSSSSQDLGQITLSMQLSAQQIQLVNNHLYSIQTMSSAQVRVAPGAPGLFYLMISGSEQQVESAKTLISAVLGQSSSMLV